MAAGENDAKIPSGFILVNKPPGPTSHDVVDELRAITGISQIGHAGTLDPLAEGLLIILIGQYTKEAQNFVKLSKAYRAVLRLGFESNTHDIDGEIIQRKEFTIPIREDVEIVLEKFRGEISQVPPQFSAIKVKGKKAYKSARSGEEVKLEARIATISNLETIWYKFPILTLDIACSSGTYIRSLARDIGDALQTGAVVSALRRTAVGNYSLTDARDLKSINLKNWQTLLMVKSNQIKSN